MTMKSAIFNYKHYYIQITVWLTIWQMHSNDRKKY